MGWMALFDDEENEVGVTGDTVWDIIGGAVCQIKFEYEMVTGRPINNDEIEHILDFAKSLFASEENDGREH